MIQRTNYRLLALLCFILPAGIFTACKKTTEAKSDKIELLSFGPTGAKPGDTLRFIGNNLDKVTAIQFTGANAMVAQNAFKQQSPELVLVVVPQATEKGYVTLKTPQGDIVSKTMLNLNVKTAASVTGITKQARYGDNITITGNYLNWVNRVTFARGKDVTTFVSKSMTQLVVAVPPDAVDGPLLLTFTGTDSAQIQTADTLRMLVPQITSLSPNPADTGKNLTITGSNLDLTAGIFFVGVTNPVTSFVSQSATQLVVKVPGSALKGYLTFSIKNSTLTVQSKDVLVINGLPPLADFPFPIYTDALQNGFQDWSYTTTHDFNSTENVRQGTKSIKAVYDAANGYQGLTFKAGTAASTTGYTKFEFSLFGDPALAGKKMNIVVNGAYGSPYQVTIVGGEWTTYALTMANIGNPATISEIVMQSAGWGGTVYVDHVGLRQ